MASIFGQLVEMFHTSKRKRPEDVEEVDGSDYEPAKRRTIRMLDRSADTTSKGTLQLAATKPRTLAPFEKAPDTPRHGYVGNEKKQRSKPGNAASFKPTNTLAQMQPGRQPGSNTAILRRRESDTQSRYFAASASSESATGRSQQGSMQLRVSSVGVLNFEPAHGTSRSRKRHRHRRDTGSQRQTSLESHIVHLDVSERGDAGLVQPEYQEVKTLQSHDISQSSAQTKSSGATCKLRDGMKYDDEAARAVLISGFGDITEDTVKLKLPPRTVAQRDIGSMLVERRYAQQPRAERVNVGPSSTGSQHTARVQVEQQPVHRKRRADGTPPRNTARPVAHRTNDESEDELAGEVTVSSAPVRHKRPHNSTPAMSRQSSQYTQDLTSPERQPPPTRLPLFGCFTAQYFKLESGLELLWSDQEQRFYLSHDNSAVQSNGDRLTFERDMFKDLQWSRDSSVVKLVLADAPDADNEVWLRFRMPAQIRWFLNKLETSTAHKREVDPADLRHEWRELEERYERVPPEYRGHAASQSRLHRPNRAHEVFADRRRGVERMATQAALDADERQPAATVSQQQVHAAEPSGIPPDVHAEKSQTMQKLLERVQSRHENSAISEATPDLKRPEPTVKLRDRMQAQESMSVDAVAEQDRRQSQRRARRPAEEPVEVVQLEPLADRRKSSRLTGITTRRAPSPEPIVRWTHVNKPQPWSQPVVFPDAGPRRVTVEFTDLERLDEGELLNDTLISFAIRRIEERMDPKYKVHFFNSYFYSTLTGDAGKKGYEYRAISRWTKNADLLANDFVVVPINHNLHWFAAIVCNVGVLTGRASQPMLIEDEVNNADQEMSGLSLAEREKGTIDMSDDLLPSTATKITPRGKRRGPPMKKYNVADPAAISLDSFGYARSSELGVLKDYLVDEGKDKRNVDIDKTLIHGITAKGLAEQTNFSDCGVFVIAYLEAFAQDPYRFVQKIMTRELDFTADYPDIKPHEMRKQLRDALLELYTQQEADRQAQAAAKAAAKTARQEQQQQELGDQRPQADTPQEPVQADT